MWDQKSDSVWSFSHSGGDASASILNSYSADVRDSFLCAGRLPRLPNFTLCDGTDNLNLPILSSSSRFENCKTVKAQSSFERLRYFDPALRKGILIVLEERMSLIALDFPWENASHFPAQKGTFSSTTLANLPAST